MNGKATGWALCEGGMYHWLTRGRAACRATWQPEDAKMKGTLRGADLALACPACARERGEVEARDAFWAARRRKNAAERNQPSLFGAAR